MNIGLPFKNVSSSIINHPVEKRGFVSVPLVGILAHREHPFSLSVNSDSCLIVNTDYRLNVNTFPK